MGHDVEASWCHDGQIHTEGWDKQSGESNEEFAKRVGSELTAALKKFPLTHDCN